MMAAPQPLTRPLLVLGGYLDPGFAAGSIKRTFRGLAGGDDRIIGLSFAFNAQFANCRRRVIAAVDKRFPSDDPARTQEVDVIGYSMGGLIGLYAAAECEAEKHKRRLRIARLFTISTPHRGAALAWLPIPIPLQRDMRFGSRFLASLMKAMEDKPYPVIPYTRLRDRVVGEANTAPDGQQPWWTPCPSFEPSHAVAFQDPRILADIARRLRGEQPWTREPAAPVPA